MKENIFLVGPPGIGKIHIAKALGHVAFSKKHSQVDLLILDDFGYRLVSKARKIILQERGANFEQ